MQLNPSGDDINFLTDKINLETPEFGEAYTFYFFIKDDNKNIIAGCNGSIVFGSIYTDQLWVDKQYRKLGLGRKLMEEVHDYGRKSGCTFATVATMSFQCAREFYEKLGYTCDFERLGYTQNSSCIFLKKTL